RRRNRLLRSSRIGCHGLVPWSIRLVSTEASLLSPMPRPCAVVVHAGHYPGQQREPPRHKAIGIYTSRGPEAGRPRGLQKPPENRAFPNPPAAQPLPKPAATTDVPATGCDLCRYFRHKAVASRCDGADAVAANVMDHGTRPWHPTREIPPLWGV